MNEDNPFFEPSESDCDPCYAPDCPHAKQCIIKLNIAVKDLTTKLNTALSDNAMLVKENMRLTSVIHKHVANNLTSIDRIHGLQDELNKHRWIPVSERLPEEINRGYYIHLDLHCPFVATFNGTTFFDAFTIYRIEDVTHWKPIILPKEDK